MSPDVLRSFARLEKQTQSLLNDLETWTAEQRNRRPSPGAWSALNLVDHLILTERAILGMMRSNVGTGHPVTLRGRCRSALVLGAMFLPTRVRVPGSVKFLVPKDQPQDLSTLREAWVQERSSLAEFLKGLSADDLKKGVFRHPVGGWTTPKGALLFLYSHLYHHEYQFRRIKRALPSE